MNKYQLECTFKTQADKNLTLRIKDVKKDLDTTAVTGVMDAMITEKIFGKNDLVVDKLSAKLIETKVSSLI